MYRRTIIGCRFELSHMTENNFQERIITLVRAFGWHRPAETPCGQPISIAEAHALLEISRTDGISQNELAVSLNLAKSTVSRLVSKIVKRGWVRREQNQLDRRAYQLYLTGQGEQIARELSAARQAKMTSIVEYIPESQRDDVLASIDILIQAIRKGEQNEKLLD